MRITRYVATIGSAGLALCLAFGFAHPPVAFGQAPAAKQGAKGGINRPPDPRVQQRKYHFADTNEDLPYAVYVSSKVSKDKKNPLIVALHGLGGDENSLMRGNALDLAEAPDAHSRCLRVGRVWERTTRRPATKRRTHGRKTLVTSRIAGHVFQPSEGLMRVGSQIGFVGNLPGALPGPLGETTIGQCLNSPSHTPEQILTIRRPAHFPE